MTASTTNAWLNDLKAGDLIITTTMDDDWPRICAYHGILPDGRPLINQGCWVVAAEVDGTWKGMGAKPSDPPSYKLAPLTEKIKAELLEEDRRGSLQYYFSDDVYEQLLEKASVSEQNSLIQAVKNALGSSVMTTKHCSGCAGQGKLFESVNFTGKFTPEGEEKIWGTCEACKGVGKVPM